MGNVPNMPYRRAPPQRHVNILGAENHDTFVIDQYLSNWTIGGQVRLE